MSNHSRAVRALLGNKKNLFMKLSGCRRRRNVGIQEYHTASGIMPQDLVAISGYSAGSNAILADINQHSTESLLHRIVWAYSICRKPFYDSCETLCTEGIKDTETFVSTPGPETECLSNHSRALSTTWSILIYL